MRGAAISDFPGISPGRSVSLRIKSKRCNGMIVMVTCRWGDHEKSRNHNRRLAGMHGSGGLLVEATRIRASASKRACKSGWVRRCLCKLPGASDERQAGFKRQRGVGGSWRCGRRGDRRGWRSSGCGGRRLWRPGSRERYDRPSAVRRNRRSMGNVPDEESQERARDQDRASGLPA